MDLRDIRDGDTISIESAEFYVRGTVKSITHSRFDLTKRSLIQFEDFGTIQFEDLGTRFLVEGAEVEKFKIELLGRPFVPPTEPGIYVSSHQDDFSLGNADVYQLDLSGNWFYEGEMIHPNALTRFMGATGTLVRLVLGE